MSALVLHDFSWQSVINAVEAVDRRLGRCVTACTKADIPYDEQLAEFLRRSKETGDGKMSSLPWFLVRDNAWEKVRVA